MGWSIYHHAMKKKQRLPLAAPHLSIQSPTTPYRPTHPSIIHLSITHLYTLVADALAMPCADKSFDLVWSMESGEHMPDKRQFIKELARVAAPGGKVSVVTWCVVWGTSGVIFSRLRLILLVLYTPRRTCPHTGATVS